jgi:hypothetical protein
MLRRIGRVGVVIVFSAALAAAQTSKGMSELKITGAVSTPLTVRDLKNLPRTILRVMTSYVVAEAQDGYHVVFALAELDSGFLDSQVLVADTLDGAPLGAKLGPFRLVEKRPARWVRMLQTITVITPELTLPFRNSASRPVESLADRPPN